MGRDDAAPEQVREVTGHLRKRGGDPGLQGVDAVNVLGPRSLWGLMRVVHACSRRTLRSSSRRTSHTRSVRL